MAVRETTPRMPSMEFISKAGVREKPARVKAVSARRRVQKPRLRRTSCSPARSAAVTLSRCDRG